METLVNEQMEEMHPAEHCGRPPDYPPLTDLGNAERFIEQHSDRVRYVTETQMWLAYEGGWWAEDPRAIMAQKGKATINSIKAEAAQFTGTDKEALLRHWKKSSSPSHIRAMLQLAQSEPEILVSANQLNTDPMLLNCQNGTLDLRTGDLRPHDPADLITKIIPVNFIPEATCPRWESFLSKIMDGDQDMVDFLSRIAGYALTGSTEEQCMSVLFGDGANGKSTFVETLRRVLGPYAMHTPSSSLLSQRFGSIRNDVARLAGARMVSAIEMGSGLRLDEPLIKQLTGGDQVTARFLYREHFEYRPEFKLLLVANHKPEIIGTDHGIWRRIHLVPFPVQIPKDEVDKNLPEKLKDELPGILAWAVRGCLEWQKQGLHIPEKVRQATEQYRMEMDRLGNFLADCCKEGADEKLPLGEAFDAYKRWADNACQDTVGKRTFGDLMRQRGFAQAKTNGIRFWKGVGLHSGRHEEPDFKKG